ncbi:unnamed protein product, partial [marine sediment metagenome]
CEKGNFIGLEIKRLPISSEFRNAFKYFRPGVAYFFEEKQVYFIIVYEFRDNNSE